MTKSFLIASITEIVVFRAEFIVETIDAVLLLLKHRMNHRIQVDKHYGPGRMLYCHAGRLNIPRRTRTVAIGRIATRNDNARLSPTGVNN